MVNTRIIWFIACLLHSELCTTMNNVEFMFCGIVFFSICKLGHFTLYSGDQKSFMCFDIIPYCKILFVLFFVYSSCFVCIIYFIYSLSKKRFKKKKIFAYICNITGRTFDDAKVFGEIYWEENDLILVLESRVGICLKTV